MSAEDSDIVYDAVVRAHVPARGWQRLNCPLCIYATGKADTRQSLGINFATGGYVCFAGDTSVMTRSGYFPISALSGQEHELLTLTPRGWKWVTAPIRSFGVAPLVEVVLRRNRVEKRIRCTSEHRWFVAHGDGWRETTTERLRAFDRLRSARLPQSGTLRPSPYGVAHGFVFGDGTRMREGRRGCRAYFFGEKDAALLKFFPFGTPKTIRSKAAVTCCIVDGLPRGWKALPSLDESPAYLMGWLSGYFAADGSVSKLGGCAITSSKREHLEYVRRVCLRLGIREYGIREYQRVGIGGISTLFHLSLCAADLCGEFFHVAEHRARHKTSGCKLARQGWVVQSVTALPVSEEVFCAVVDGSHNFVLDGHILTGNCHKCQSTGLVPAYAPELDVIEQDTAAVVATLQDAAVAEPEAQVEVESWFGYVPLALPGELDPAFDWAREYVLGRGISWEAIRDAEVGAANIGPLANRIIVPHFAPNGDVVGWIARDITGRAYLKYRYSKGMNRKLMWNQRQLAEDTAAPLALVEGVFDALPLWPDVSAFLGKPTSWHIETLEAHRGRPLVMLLDGDARYESWALANRLKLAGVPSVGVAILPPGEDPNSLGRDVCMRLIGESMGRVPRFV